MIDYSFYISVVLLSVIGNIILYFFFANILQVGFDKTKEVQKVHIVSSLRIGGISIILLSILMILSFDVFDSFPVFILCLFPLFVSAFLEDLFQNTSIKFRFIAMLFTSISIVTASNAYLVDIDIKYLNSILENKTLSIFITTIGIIVTCNAWNFIDGLNGIASGLGALALLLFYLISGPNEIYIYGFREFLLILSSITFGFFILNILTGRVFLGDTGSYLLGIIIGWSGVIIVTYNDNVSPWAIFTIIIYPASEITVSVFRRIIKKNSPFHADSFHLHSLFYKIMLYKFKINKQLLNSICGIVIFIFASLPGIYCLIIKGSFPKTLYAVFLFFILYILIYNILLFIIKSNKIPT